MMAWKATYEEAPAIWMSISCQGENCGFDTVSHDGDDFVCSDCGTHWEDLDGQGQLRDEDDA